MSDIVLYGIANCDSIKKARKWLTEHNVDYQFHDYKKSGIDAKTLRHWASVVDWEVLLNRRGTTWRKLDESDKTDINESRAIDLMIEHTSMIKRPVLTVNDHIEVGFNADVYSQILAS